MTPSPAAKLVDWTLEASVVGSFTRIGYHTRRRLFDWTPLQSLRLDGKVAIVTGATSGLGRSGRRVDRGAGRARLHRRARPGADRTRPQRDLRRGRLRGRGRPRRSLVPRGDRRLRGPLRREARPPRRARPERRCAHPRIHGHGRGERDDARDARLVAVPVDPCAAASARGVGTVARDRGRVRRHVHRAARRRCPRPRTRHLRRDEDIRALQARTGRAGRGVDARTARHRHRRQRHASRLGRHPRASEPRFQASRRVVGRLLRTPEEGADTIVWLAAAPDAADLSGLFFLDRRARAKHRLRRTRRPDEAREAARLWRLCTERTAPFAAEPGGSAA